MRGLAPHVRERVVAISGGNPLAVIELSTSLDPGRPAEPVTPVIGEGASPVAARLLVEFARRAAELPDATRSLLLVAVADDTGDAALVLTAARHLGAGLADLGGLAVELRHFGPGNGPGDTIVYVPSARAAWTGNYLCHAGTAHMLLQGGPAPYLASLRRMRAALPGLRTIVPGHGPMGDGPEAIAWLIDYLEALDDDVSRLYAAGHSLEETMRLCPSPFADGLDPRLLRALAAYEGPQDAIRDGYLGLCRNLHRLNILATYRIAERGAGR